LGVPYCNLTFVLKLVAELEARVDQLKASETDLKNIVYQEKDAREVLEYEYK
jgi:hypothetical protein